ncbi:hypothetical protein KR044_006055, partial [Drosophila immigrans]
EAVYLRFTNVKCKVHNTTWIRFYECRLKAIRRNLTVFNMNGTLDYSVNDVIVHLQMFKRANGYKPFIINTSYDACSAIKNFCNPYGKFVYNLYKDYSNFNHTCPYVGPLLVKGFHVQAEKMFIPLATGHYLIVTNWIIEKTSQLTVKVYFEYTENIIDM